MVIGLVIFACVFGGAMLGMWLRTRLPGHHLSSESKDVVKLGMGLVGTMTALILGLLVASAKSSYDTEKAEITQMAAKVIWLDRMLGRFGPGSREARDQLRASVATIVDRIWPTDGSKPQLEPSASGVDMLYSTLTKLSPETPEQRHALAEVEKAGLDLVQTRWLLYEQDGRSISLPLLVIVTVWLTLIFVSYGLFAPPNLTVGVSLLVCALSVAGALFLVMELDRPFEGLIQIPSGPMRSALAQLGR